jgi:antitoxin component YwqK of YwqJK toxin-antitoxin module
MRIFLLTYILLLNFNLLSQHLTDHCPLDTNSNFVIIFDVVILEDTLVVSPGILSVDSKPSIFDIEFCLPIPIEYDESVGKYFVTLIKEDKQLGGLILSPDKVRTLEIHFISKVDTVFDISKLKILENLDLHLFESITIKTNSVHNFKVELNLNKWPNYNALTKANNLAELNIIAQLCDKNLEKQLAPFRKLKKIRCNQYLSYNRIDNSCVESVNMTNPDYFFVHYLAEMPLVDYYSNETSSMTGINNDANSYASKAYFIYNLNIKMKHHPLHELDSLVGLNLSLNYKEDGIISLTRSDLFPNKDTNDEGGVVLATGEVKNGVPIGNWLYKLYHYKPENFYYDYSKQESVEFPENGSWSWRYPNGILAIEGQFKNGAKEGIWKFYDIDGNISNIKKFKKDRPRGLFIDYVIQSNFDLIEVRTFYSEHDYIMSTIRDGEFEFKAGQHIQTLKRHYSIDLLSSNLLIINNLDTIREFIKDQKQYNNRIKRHFIKRLYPEFI